MNHSLDKIMKRSLSDWGDITTKEFKRDIEFLTDTIKAQSQEINELKNQLKPTINLSDPDLLKKYIFTLDGRELTEQEVQSMIKYTRAMLAFEKLNEREKKIFITVMKPKRLAL